MSAGLGCRMPIFSVIVPVKDDPIGLPRAIASVLAQSLADWELVVVDDGSSSPVVVPADPRIRLVRNEQSGGPAAARNVGASVSQGVYLAFCDSDDAFAPERLGHAFASHADGAALVVCEQSERPRDLDALRLVASVTPHMGTISIRREDWQGFDERYGACEDVEWWIRVGRTLNPVFTASHDYIFIGTEHPRAIHSNTARMAFSFLLLRDHESFFEANPAARGYRLSRIAKFAAGLNDGGDAILALVDAFRADPSRIASRDLVHTAVAFVKARDSVSPSTGAFLPPIPRAQARRWVPLKFGGPDSRLSYPRAGVTAAAWAGNVLPRVARGYLRRASTLGSDRVFARTAWGVFVLSAKDTRLLAPCFDEPLETAILARLVSPGDTFVDVGANRGWFTHMASARVGPDGRVFAFEPDARMVARLAEMERENHWTNVTVMPEALSDVTGEAVFQAVADPALSHLMEPSESESRGIRVPTTDFSAFALQHDLTKLNAMKLDVEGGEVRVLRGLSRWLRTSGCRPVLLVEVEERHLARAGTGVNDLLDAAPADYVSIAIDYKAGGLMREPYIGQPFTGRNILMVPRESVDSVFRKIHSEESPPSLR